MRPSATAPRRRPGVLAAAAVCCALLGGCGAPAPTGSAAPEPSVTSSVRPPSPGAPGGGAADPGRWGAHGTRERACSAVTNEVVSLSLLPTNLAVSDDAQDVRRIERRVQEAVDASPPRLRAHFARIRDLVASYGDAVAQQETGTAFPTPRSSPGQDTVAGASPAASGSPAPGPAPGAGVTADASAPASDGPAPDRDGGPDGTAGPGGAGSPSPSAGSSPPEFDDRALERSLEPVRQWLRDSCSGAVPLG